MQNKLGPIPIAQQQLQQQPWQVQMQNAIRNQANLSQPSQFKQSMGSLNINPQQQPQNLPGLLQNNIQNIKPWGQFPGMMIGQNPQQKPSLLQASIGDMNSRMQGQLLPQLQQLGRPVLGSLKNGGMIKKTGLYHLHKGERVIKASDVKNIRVKGK